MDNNKCSLFTMLIKQNLIKVFHCELIKKKCLSDLLCDLSIQKLCFI